MLSYFLARGKSVVKHSKEASPEGRLRVLYSWPVSPTQPELVLRRADVLEPLIETGRSKTSSWCECHFLLIP